LSPGDHDRFGVRRKQVDGLAKGAGCLVIEGRGFHCYASRGNTEPEAIYYVARSRQRCGRAPNGLTGIANPQPRYRQAKGSEPARAYSGMTPIAE
jgi:hypothetical protein